LVSYREQATTSPDAVLWTRAAHAQATTSVILPDGCLDLIWDGERLFVAGPDTSARTHQSPANTAYAALRFSGGLGPAILGVPAHELRDRTVELSDLWSRGAVHALSDQVATDPVPALTTG